MNRYVFAAVLVSSALLGANAARADFLDGNKLLSACHGVMVDKGVCFGYLMGVNDMLQVMQREHQWGGYCSPNNMTVNQMELVLEKYFRDNPKDLSLSGAGNVIVALQSAFPCPKK